MNSGDVSIMDHHISFYCNNSGCYSGKKTISSKFTMNRNVASVLSGENQPVLYSIRHELTKQQSYGY